MQLDKITGLTAAQVEQSRREHGTNVLTPPKRKPLLKQFLECFDDPLIKILLVALLLSVGIAAYEYFGLQRGADVLLEPLGIFIAITLATLVGFLVEVNANKKFNILNKMHDDVPVKVKRQGHVTQIARRDVVVGDIVMLDAGEKVPADGELLQSVSMTVDESSFTGEPLAHKSHKPEDTDPKATYPTHVLLRGSSVAEGHGTMQVTQVGDATEYGKIYTDAQIENDVETPLMQQFDQLGRWIARASYVVGAAIVVGRMLLFFTDGNAHDLLGGIQYFIETVMLAVTLIVVSVPEGLPMSVTLSLAMSMHRMLASHNLVRKMHACETMGAATVICSDKTGTLTQNQMQVHVAHFTGLPSGDQLAAGDEQSIIVAHSIACNSTAYLDNSDKSGRLKAIGNPTEGALLLWLSSQDIDYLALRDACDVEAQLPFSTQNKFMATVVRCPALGGRRLLLVKGASEIIRNYCSGVAGGAKWDDIFSELHGYQCKALRTLGFAYKILADDEPVPIADGRLSATGLTFMGIVAISDPVRPEVPAAIGECLRAGIQVKIVTGDTPGTAQEIGRQVGLWQDADDPATAQISGEEFAALPDDEAARRAEQIKIMSRARPGDKARLVKLLQQQGEVVAVTGDGTNDAPALNAAQVGLSMGDGTSVAKEASDITIMDNSFASIGKAVMWGRSLYKNIQRFILFQLTVNVAACLLVAICSFVSEQPVLTVTQMLWVNLIMDTFAALALASLPPNREVMLDAPRRAGTPIITRSMAIFLFGMGVTFAVAMLATFVILLLRGGGGLVNGTIDKQETAIYFSAFVFLQFWNLFNAKSFDAAHHSAFHNWRQSKVFFAILAVIFVGQVLIVQFGGAMFGVKPMTLVQWVAVVGFTSPVMIIGELYHLLQRKKKKTND